MKFSKLKLALSVGLMVALPSLSFANGGARLIYEGSGLIDAAVSDPELRECIDKKKLTHYANMWELTCNSKPKSLDGISNHYGLEHLSFHHADIVSLEPISSLPKLFQLGASFNNIRDISPLEYMYSLERINLRANEIIDIRPLANLPELYKLDLSENDIIDISPLKNITTMVNLSLRANKINNIDILANLTKLRSLSIGGNEITDISVLEKLSALSSLYLFGNDIDDISVIKKLPNLKNLGISGTKITDLSILLELDSLEKVWVDDLPQFSCLDSIENKRFGTTIDAIKEACFPELLTTDTDADGIYDHLDNCPEIYNNSQWDKDKDGLGNKCDSDIDGDGFSNEDEYAAGTKPWNADSYPLGDSDGDGIDDATDNCPTVANDGQWDRDEDGIGNSCDDDIDGDGFSNEAEREAGTSEWNVNNFPIEGTLDSDGDGVVDTEDNCPAIANNGQWDKDNDNIGNMCDDDIDGDGVSNENEILAGTKVWDASSN